MTTRRSTRGRPNILSMPAKVPAPLRGMRPDLATLARQLEDEVNLLWEHTGAQEDAGKALEAKFTQLKVHVSEVASGERPDD